MSPTPRRSRGLRHEFSGSALLPTSKRAAASVLDALVQADCIPRHAQHDHRARYRPNALSLAIP